MEASLCDSDGCSAARSVDWRMPYDILIIWLAELSLCYKKILSIRTQKCLTQTVSHSLNINNAAAQQNLSLFMGDMFWSSGTVKAGRTFRNSAQTKPVCTFPELVNEKQIKTH